MTHLTRFALALMLPAALGACGLYVPEKDIFSDDSHDLNNPQNLSSQGDLENLLIGHIRCELQRGIYEADRLPNTKWLTNGWGTAVTLKIQIEEQSGFNPGVAFNTPFANSVRTFPVAGGNSVTLPQSFALGLGLSATARSTRVESIQFTLSNDRLLADGKVDAQTNTSCDAFQKGVTIQSDLKIAQFIYDKASIATTHETYALPLESGKKKEAPTSSCTPQFNVATGKPKVCTNPIPVKQSTKPTTNETFNTFQEEIIFVTSYGGNVTPTWHFARVAVDPSGTLLNATRTKTNDLIITMGKIQPNSSPLALATQSKSLQDAANIGSATRTGGQ